jgi:hypothetical protein
MRQLGVAALMLFACARSPASERCRVQTGEYAVRYTLKEGTGPCSTLVAERLLAESSDASPAVLTLRSGRHDEGLREGVVHEDGGSTLRRDPDASHSADARGTFVSAVPDAEGLCTVGELSEARQDWEAVMDASGADELAPAETSRYQWRNAQALLNADSEAEHLRAELTFIGNADCTAQYEATAIWPAVSCDDGSGAPSLPLCQGLRSNIAVSCDADSLLCVPEKPFPSLK